ncbi:MAG TPA: DHA2 family efflux MFS transporter permease subunit [Candidatus Dormibacteraeota bacterium]|nr:DHA2 family efflux MFS transporter permease subunit [Candidatus Dormibacteraeota bacterium]
MAEVSTLSMEAARSEVVVVAPPQQQVSGRTWAALAILCLGAFLVVLDTTIVNIAIPSIMTGLHSSLDQVLWVLNAYTLVYAALLITGGRLGDLYGPRRLLIVGILVFGGASVACALAPSAGILIAARVLQGVGGGLMTPQTLALIPAIVPANRRGRAIGLWSGSAGLAAAVGPSLGGVLVTTAGWRWVFLVNVPVGIVAIAGAYALLPKVVPGRRHRLDIGGIALASLGLLAVVFGLVEGQRYAWGTITGPITIPAVMAAGVVLLAAFVLWERRQPEPLLPPALFASRSFTVSAWVILVIQTVMLAFIVVAGLFFQSALRMTALDAGLALAPMPLSLMLVAPLAGRLAERVDIKFVLMGAMLVAASGVGWLAASVSTIATPATFIPALVVTGAGLGCGFAVVMTVGMRGIAPQVAGAASGVLNTFRQVGGAMGGAIAVALLQSRLSLIGPAQVTAHNAVYANSFVDAFRAALVVPVLLLLLAALSCLLLKPRTVPPA